MGSIPVLALILRALLPRLARGDGWNAQWTNRQAGAGSIPAADGRVVIFEQACRRQYAKARRREYGSTTR